MIREIKKWIRELGWENLAPADRCIRTRYFKSVYDPVNTIRELNLPDHEFGNDVRGEIIDHDPYRFSEYLLEFEQPVIVEPLHGMVIVGKNHLARHLLAVHRGVEVLPPHQLEYRKACKNLMSVPRAVLLRNHYGEMNYFHFYNDIIPILEIVKKFPDYEEVPFLVSRRQYETVFFQGLIKRAGWKDRNWVVQDGGAVKVEKLVVAKGLPMTESWVRLIWQLFQVPEAKNQGGRKIFLKRGDNSRRQLANRREVESVCREHGFESVNTDGMNIDEQIELFRSCRHLVAEHGAGCSNVLFRRGHKLSFLELCPPRHVSTCFFRICRLMGHEYDWLRGRSDDGSGDSYSITVADLRNKLSGMRDA